MTQVVSVAEPGVFHNRLTHTLEVAQIGRRLAEKLRKEQPEDAEATGGLDPEVVEAAALAHDLGHPPFGHIAEEALDECVKREGLDDGYEGNAQSFRIVTRLAIRRSNMPGLNLTRATSNAILKYPWFRQTSGKQQRKWGAYHSEDAEFLWAREGYPHQQTKSTEAELMDWADDIAYSVHDTEDFYVAGLIPLHRLRQESDEQERFLSGALLGLRSETEEERERYRRAFLDIIPLIPITEPYEGTINQQSSLRTFTAFLIKRYIEAIKLVRPHAAGERRVAIQQQLEDEVAVLKQLTWHYVINRPALATQQYGQVHLIKQLFEIFMEAARGNRQQWLIFPAAARDMLAQEVGQENANHGKARIVADLIAGMTEQQAINMHRRLTGVSGGSALELLL